MARKEKKIRNSEMKYSRMCSRITYLSNPPAENEKTKQGFASMILDIYVYDGCIAQYTRMRIDGTVFAPFGIPFLSCIN